MKKIIIFMLLLIISNANASFLGIVDRTATRDTLAIPFCLLDSIGSPTTLASGDSVYVNVFAPGGVEVFDDSMAYNDASIKSSDWEDYAGVQYMYMEQVSVLDGASTADGVFTVHVTVQDLTSAALTTTVMHTFQIVNSTLESSLDSAGLAAVAATKALDSLADILDSLESHDDWIATEVTAAKALDSLADILDSLESHDDWIATEVTAAKALDSLADILDSLESHDDWIAAATEVAKAIDSLADVLDSLETISTWLQDSLYGVIDSLQNFPARVDLIWDEDTTGHKTDPQMGFWITQGGAASIADADMAAIADSVWQADTSGHNNVNASFGEHLYDLAVAIADAKMGGIADSVWDKAIADMVNVSGGAGDFLRDTLLAIIDTLQNQDDWIATAAEVAKVIDSLADILDSLETQSTWIQDSLYAILDTLQLYDGRYALAAELTKAIDSINAVLDTLQLQDGWVATEATAAKALDSLADILDTLESHDDWVATEVTAAKALDSLADILDSLESHDDWIAAAANLTKAIDSINALLDTLQLWDTRIDSLEAALADANIGDKVWADGSPTYRDSIMTAIDDGSMADKIWKKLANSYTGTAGSFGDVIFDSLDALVSAAGGSLSDADMGSVADSVWDKIYADMIDVGGGAGASLMSNCGGGSGDNAVKYYAVDTSGTDVAIMDVKITMNTIEGVYDASNWTNTSGYTEFTAPTDEMVFLGRKCGYFFARDTNDISGSLTDTLIGYNVPLQASPEPNLCRVQGYVYVPGGEPHRTIKVTFTVIGEAVHNDCDGTAFIAEPVTAWTSIHDDSLGFFYADLVPSGCLLKADGDSLQYNITQELRGPTGKETLIWVPQAESYEVVW